MVSTITASERAPEDDAARRVQNHCYIFQSMLKPTFTPCSKGDMFRDAESFPEFPKMAGIDPLHQGRLFQAIGVEAISAMEWLWEENWRVGPRVVNDSMWFWFESGGGSGWTVDAKNRFRYEAGDAILIPQGVEHFIDQNKGATAHVYAVHFNVHLFSVMNPLTFLGVPILIRGSEYLDLGSTSKRLSREFARKAPGWQTLMNLEISATLLSILRTHGDRLNPRLNSLTDLPRFLRVFEQIEQRLGDSGYTVTEMARCATLSEVQFRKLFRQITRLSPIRYLQKRRIERACMLLRTSEESIQNISMLCGFSGVHFFYRIFRVWTKMTPSRYRVEMHL